VNFAEYCAHNKITPEEALRESKREDDLIEQPGSDPVGFAVSKIHGVGVFATCDRCQDYPLGLALDNQLHRTSIIGRFINHAHNPNCFLKSMHDGSYQLYPLLGVKKGDELTIAYEAVDRIRADQK